MRLLRSEHHKSACLKLKDCYAKAHSTEKDSSRNMYSSSSFDLEKSESWETDSSTTTDSESNESSEVSPSKISRMPTFQFHTLKRNEEVKVLKIAHNEASRKLRVRNLIFCHKPAI